MMLSWSSLNAKVVLTIVGIVIGSAGSLSAAVFFYYNSIKGEMEELRDRNGELELAIELNEQTIDILKSEQQRADAERIRLNDTIADIRENSKILTEKLAEHNLGELAVAKTDSIERIVNDATVDALRCFEIISGSPLTDAERNAKNATQFNSECPYLFDTID